MIRCSIRRRVPVAALLAGMLTSGCEQPSGPGHDVEAPWALIAPSLVIDTHTHTRATDGKLSAAELVALALQNGCEALAITDHSDLELDAVTPGYFDTIDSLRAEYAGLLLFAGLEWNIPPYEGREHVTVLVDPAHEREVLSTLKANFDGKGDVRTALAGITSLLGSSQQGLMIYNHPARKDHDVDENLRDVQMWRDVNRLFIGFEGGPGHQKKENPGAYKGILVTEDRWDPVVAQVGGVWDRLLDGGMDVWGALAVSDFHNAKSDYAPCEFARTHVQAPTRDLQGILAGLRAGTFWADQGNIIDDLGVALVVPGLGVPVVPGETVHLDGRKGIDLVVALTRGRGAYDAALSVEIIGNGRSGVPEMLATQTLAPTDNEMRWSLPVVQAGGDGRTSYFRVRVRKSVADGPDLLAYSNPVRVRLLP